MLYFSIFLVLVLFTNFLVITHLEKEISIAEVPQKKETITSANYDLQNHVNIEQESDVFSYFTNPKNNLVANFY